MKCLKEKCIHHEVCALYTFSGYASDECGFYETKPHVENEKQQWIPVTFRKMTKEEAQETEERLDVKLQEDEKKMFNCPLPEDNQEILVCYSWGHVAIDRCEYDPDYGYGLESNGDWDGITAWMPLPEPYKPEGGAAE